MVTCQVIEKDHKWPYIAPCSGKATKKVSQRIRQDCLEITEEYICQKHADALVKAFGPDAVGDM